MSGSGVSKVDHTALLSAALASLRKTRLNTTQHIYVAYSGGLDSHALLHLICTQLGTDRVTALHINHQLSPHADAWQKHCQIICQQLGVNFEVERVTVPKDGSGQEASARAARYRVFDEKVGSEDVLVLGHHADDQVETVLYRLLRGAGSRGLAGMPAERSLLRGCVLRPLLTLPRATLRAYAEKQELQWIEDESNQCLDYDRNYLRHKVVPSLLERWPDLNGSVERSARHSAQAEKLNADLAELDLAGLDVQAARLGKSLSLDRLMSLPDYRQRNVLRHWRISSGLSLPGHRAIDAALSDVIGARDDAAPVVSWPGGEWRRFANRLFCLPADWRRQKTDTQLSPSQPADPLTWSLSNKTRKQTLLLPHGASLSATLLNADLLSTTLQREQGSNDQALIIPPEARVSVGFRQGGERCKPAGRGASTSLKKLFQEYQLEPWLRAHIPLIYIDGELAAVGDLWVCEGFNTTPDQPAYHLDWLPSE